MPRPEAKPTKTPWIIQEAFPAYHGVAWYWRNFVAPANPHPGDRYLLRFWQVDYLAEVWLNGVPVGGHEGGEAPFVLDVTERIKPGAKNHLAVRVLNPSMEKIDGIRLNETAHGAKFVPFRAGGGFDCGGITDSVELICAGGLCRQPFRHGRCRAQHWQDAHRGRRAQCGGGGQKSCVDFTVASARDGETTAAVHVDREFPAGNSTIKADLTIDAPRLWQLTDPYLYRVTARVRVERGQLDRRAIDPLRIPGFPLCRRLLPPQRPAHLPAMHPHGQPFSNRPTAS